MSQRVERLASEIRQILGESLSRQEIKDPRVQAASLITFTHVRLTGDLRQATALFIVHGADRGQLERVREGLTHASGYLRRKLGRELRIRVIPNLSFEIDDVFDREAKVDQLLREISVEETRRGAERGPADDQGASEANAEEEDRGSSAPDQPAPER
jgi:ribosome-binding factor A